MNNTFDTCRAVRSCKQECGIAMPDLPYSWKITNPRWLYCRLFSSGTLVSSSNKTDRHDILLKVALNIITLTLILILPKFSSFFQDVFYHITKQFLFANTQILRQYYFHLLRKRCRSVWEFDNKFLNDGHTVV